MGADERLESKEWERRLKTGDGPPYSYSLFLPDRIAKDAKSATPVESRYESVADYDAVLLLITRRHNGAWPGGCAKSYSLP